MKKYFLFICILFSLVSLGQTTDWVKSFGGVESDKGISIGVDSLGYVYCSGWYNTEATFGNITLKTIIVEVQTRRILFLRWIHWAMCYGQFLVEINLEDVVMIEH